MVTVFIRTYERDLEWLRYCLCSIHRNLVGWNEIIICIPKGQESKLNGLITTERVVLSPNYKDDYIGQQISKLQSFRHIQNDFVLFVDSDLIFHKGADVARYFRDGKPVILKESYDLLIARHPKLKMQRWQDAVAKVFKEVPRYEYMRRAPQLFRRSTLENLNLTFPSLEAHAICQPKRHFSEFNVLGFYVEKHESDVYSIIDLEHEPFPTNPATQHRSWLGITPKVFSQLVEHGVADIANPPDFSKLPDASSRRRITWPKFRNSIMRLLFGG
jgi:hypothetical protein